MWMIVQMQSTLKRKLRCNDQSDWVRCMKKTKEDNDMIDRIDLVYVEIETELRGAIWLSTVCEEN